MMEFFHLLGGKMETTDGSFVAGLTREKNEEIGEHVRLEICPYVTYNVLFQKKDGSHMVLPHYIARYVDGIIQLNEEYSEYAWVKLEELDRFGPKIENIPKLVAWAWKTSKTINRDDWIML